MNILSVYLIIILSSFHPADPGWMQSVWNDRIVYNVGGMIGAKISDFLFFCIGILAYVIPLFVLYYSWILFLQIVSLNFLNICTKLLKICIFFLICCTLTQLIFNDIFYFPPGGIIGSILFDFIKLYPYTVLYISCILLVYQFRKLCLHLTQIIYDKIKDIIQFIMYFFLYQNKEKKNYRVNKQTYNNIRVPPSIFYEQSNTIPKNKSIPPFTTQSKYQHKIIKFLKPNLELYNNHNVHNYYTKKNSYDIFFYNKKIFNKFIKYITKIRYQKNIMNIIVSQQEFRKKIFSSIKNTNKKNTNSNNLLIQKKSVLFNKKFQKYQSKSIEKKSHAILISNNKNNNQNASCIQFFLPNVDLLMKNFTKKAIDYPRSQKTARLIEQKLLEYRIIANVEKIIPGPVVTRFELNLSAGIKSSKISNLSRDLARALSVASVQVIEVIPGTPYVGLEIPNKKRYTVYLQDLICSSKFKKNSSPLALILGQDITGKPIIKDLRNMPHLLVAGTTGSGKSVGINAMIISILYAATPEDVRFIMIDPKILELSIYSNIPHLLTEVITETKDVESILQWCVTEMENRYRLMAIFSVKNLESYNNYIQKEYILKKNQSIQILIEKNINNFQCCISYISKKLPYIVIVIDEFSDLMIMTTKKVEILIIRLTQKARAAGIHIILSTQRPSVDVITGVIKANIPARIAYTVSSKIDSRTILGQSGAESLLGMGDMLYLPPNSSNLIRIHGVYVTDKEIYTIVQFWKHQMINSNFLYKI